MTLLCSLLKVWLPPKTAATLVDRLSALLQLGLPAVPDAQNNYLIFAGIDSISCEICARTKFDNQLSRPVRTEASLRWKIRK